MSLSSRDGRLTGSPHWFTSAEVGQLEMLLFESWPEARTCFAGFRHSQPSSIWQLREDDVLEPGSFARSCV